MPIADMLRSAMNPAGGLYEQGLDLGGYVMPGGAGGPYAERGGAPWPKEEWAEWEAAVNPTMERARGDWLASYGEGGANRAALLRNVAELRPDWSPEQGEEFFLSQVYPGIEKTVRDVPVYPVTDERRVGMGESPTGGTDWHSGGGYIGHQPIPREAGSERLILNPMIMTEELWKQRLPYEELQRARRAGVWPDGTPMAPSWSAERGPEGMRARLRGSHRTEGMQEAIDEFGSPFYRYPYREGTEPTGVADYPYDTAMHEVGHAVDQAYRDALSDLYWGPEPDSPYADLASELHTRNFLATERAFPFAGSEELSPGGRHTAHELLPGELRNLIRNFRAIYEREPAREDVRLMMRGDDPEGGRGPAALGDFPAHHWQQGKEPGSVPFPRKRREYDWGDDEPTRRKPASIEDILRGFREFSYAAPLGQEYAEMVG